MPPKTLIESWFPIEALSVESIRERASMTALPPTYYLHVWWARRPLITSRAAILASLLPQWSEDWPDDLKIKFPTEADYQAWFLRALGILGDPVQAKKLVDYARQKNITLKENPYDYKRAFSINPTTDTMEILLELLKWFWGTHDLTMMDPMSGGGSIPFESLRYGFTTYANELNPVPSVILKATLDYPARFGEELVKEIKSWGTKLNERVSTRLAQFYPMQEGEKIRRYLWARTVPCPVTGKTVPLSPNWWLSKSPPIAVRLLTNSAWDEPKFEVVEDKDIDFDPNTGTVSRGVGYSPWTGETISGNYIKEQAQNGAMGQILYALSIQTHTGYEFREPNQQDLEAANNAETALKENLLQWEANNLVPNELFPQGNDLRPIKYGMKTWADFFSPRQLISLVILLEELTKLGVDIRKEADPDKALAIETYLAFVLDKCPNYNSRLSVWHALRAKVANTFNRHDFSFAWSHAEMTMPNDGILWALNQTVKAYKELAKLTTSAQLPLWANHQLKPPVERLKISQGSATDLVETADQSVHLICVDPPYYDNVMYAELSDFFYVWLKRSVGHLYPEFFMAELTNKDDEIVANPARFAAFGKQKKTLAKQDYEHKMAAAFQEMYRVLKDDGILTLMFTHKQVEAWDTLASALIGAGFVIKASWPVHTESEHSLHQAKKNAAASTILLVCRKRKGASGLVVGASSALQTGAPAPIINMSASQAGAEAPTTSASSRRFNASPVWWDDLKGRVRQTARDKAEAFAAQGISGVDLYISTFGPVLAVISEQWPVLTSEVDEKTGQPKPLRPETALDLAREEVVTLRKQGLLLGRNIQFDPITDWYLMAWLDFQAEQFPADEARKLALILGLDVEKEIISQKRVATKKGKFIMLQKPAQRRRKGLADPEALVFDTQLDAIHAAMLIYEEDGPGACEAFLKRTNLLIDSTFRGCMQAMLNAIPRTQVKGKFVRSEADTLEKMRLAYFEELTVPVEEEPKQPAITQSKMW